MKEAALRQMRIGFIEPRRIWSDTCNTLRGRNWRDSVEAELSKLGVTVFNPYKKPFEKDVREDEEERQSLDSLMGKGSFEEVARRMRTVRTYDLNLVDRSDFIIAHIIPAVASWGSAEELVTAIRMKKPVFISMEGGKKKPHYG